MTHTVRRGVMPLLALTLASAALLSACGGDDPTDGGPPASFTYSAEIRRTAMGVPHIKAADWGGVGYGYGYAQAQDDLCTIANSMLTFRGERSRYFGADAVIPFQSTIGQPKNLDADFYHRHVLNDDVMQRLIAAQPDRLKQVVAGYAAGYNRYVREIKAGGDATAHTACRGEDWVKPLTDTDVFRRMYAAHFAAGYSNYLVQIANATAPVTAMTSMASPGAPSAGQRPRVAKATRLAIASDRLPSFEVGGKEGVGSNMMGFGTAATGDSSPLLFGNPHWYWRGPDRFYQAQFTIPGELNVSGTSFLGVPVIQIGHTNDVAWSHTVSAARRYGLFQLSLVPGDPTSYLRDGAPVKMTARSLIVPVKQGDGTVINVTRTLYESQYGPIVNLGALNPALGWNANTAFAIRDINAANFRVFRVWLRWSQARSLDELAAIQREESSIPWVNTVAVARGSGQAWYADIGAVPNVSPAQMASCATPLTAALSAALPRTPVLDGSRSSCDWLTDADSKQPGAIGTSRMPSLLRDDYVLNSNDSYWLSNPAAPLTGFSDLMGPAGTASLSLRTRLAHLLAQGRLAGTDGYAGNKATSDTVRAMVLNSRALSAELMKDQALALLCAPPTPISVTTDTATGETFNPARSVDPTEACAALQAWDNKGLIASRGAHVWDEFWSRAARLPETSLYAVPFSAADPVNTPRDLNAAAVATLKQAFGAAILRIQASGYALTATRGETLFAPRGSDRIPLFGGCGTQGYFTIACSPTRIDQGGYTLDTATSANSYLQVVRFPAEGVEAYTFLTFSLSDDPASTHYSDYTRAYSAGQWQRMPFSEAEIAKDPALTTKTISE
ncbi:MAG: penicillin acylase family protein [Mitsuaria chitosanitabida]|uniref:penicillin acylase family protein n=1 Tax=Roseateles chitosanitabidus TaxID=65048 RepID=UPI001B231330|nr:penicillin acylase family protein [Roseateles chitosanitabidus]MBO9689073.1 penicillin acylase family protein [Roseateles chitosanitabidus]